MGHLDNDPEVQRKLQKIKDLRAMTLERIESAQNVLDQLNKETEFVKGYGSILHHGGYADAAILLKVAKKEVEWK